MHDCLNQKEKELYKRVDEVLHYIWDPVGIQTYPEARDEYYSYIPQVYAMLTNSKTKDDISIHLINITKKQMGLDPDIHKIDRVAEILIGWKERLLNRSI